MKPLLSFAAALLPQAALAHPGSHHDASWVHLLSQADHLATVTMVTALGAAAWLILRGRP